MVSRLIVLRMRNVSDKVAEKLKTHLVCSITAPPPPENHAIYELVWKNMVQPERPQVTI
jgi:hypothetical protein